MTIDTALVLKAAGAEASGTDGAGTALDLGGPWGLITAIITVTAVAGAPPSKLDLDFEGSDDNSDFFVVARAPQITAPGVYRVPIHGIAAADQLTTTASFLAFQAAPRYLRKKSTVTAGTGGDGVTYSIHLSA
jgi:hypothetical protein